MINNADTLSETAKSLWAKASQNNKPSWTPLYIHMMDSAAVCSILWKRWLPDSVRTRITIGITNGGRPMDLNLSNNIAAFICGVHDIGKATPAFQSRSLSNKILTETFHRALSDCNLPFRNDLNDPGAIPHSTASELILEREGFDRSLAVIPGGHHGFTPTKKELRLLPTEYPFNTGFDDDGWRSVQKELVEFCCRICNVSLETLKSIKIDINAQILLTGLSVMSDWIASNEQLFPLTVTIDEVDYNRRLCSAVADMRIPSRWIAGNITDCMLLFKDRFSFSPRPFQKIALEIASAVSSPGLMIMEAPMGEGKTEAALAVSEMLMHRFGAGGMMFALPTQATADGLFPRIRNWLETSSQHGQSFHTIFLAHGKSRYNMDYNSLDHIGFCGKECSTSRGVIHDWFTGKRKGILSDFVIGTVDQVLMMGLKQKHCEMRHLGLSGKIVIIDECHAYDAYMGSYLSKALEWLGSYGVPTILLSATLPPERRRTLIESYTSCKTIYEMTNDESYPRITYSDGKNVKITTPASSNRSKAVSIVRISNNDLLDRIRDVSSEGGYVGVIVNTVRRAQQLRSKLVEIFQPGEIRLLHSGFTSLDRSLHESEVLESLGSGLRRPPPFRLVVVGTQVMEQSMDLDFDALFTDLCPMDLLLQRIGRLHRHDNDRPASMRVPTCYVIEDDEGFDPGSEAVYGRYQLYNTHEILPKVINLPDDIPDLVNRAYDPEGVDVPEYVRDDYLASKTIQLDMVKDKERRARIFQIGSPGKMHDLTGWLKDSANDTPDGRRAEATVRDSDRSVEVILIQRIDGALRLLPWVPEYGGRAIRTDTVPPLDVAFTMAGCKVPLPRALVSRDTDRVIDEISNRNSMEIPRCWDQSEWLNGELFVILNERLEADVCGKTVSYDDEKGMMIV